MKTNFHATNQITQSELPQSIQEIDASVQRMDKINGTSFYSWLRDDSHLDQVAMHCKRILNDYESSSISLGLCWLMREWSASRSAELLIKMFYHWGMASEKFARIVSAIMLHLSASGQESKADDILLTLLIGEEAKLTATFLYLVQKEWSAKKTVEKISMLASRMDWDFEFSRTFMITFTSNLYSNHHCSIGDGSNDAYVAAAIKLVNRQFKNFQSSTSDANPIRKLVQPSEHLEFLGTVLKVVLDDHEKALNSHSINDSFKCKDGSNQSIPNVQPKRGL